MDLIDKLQQLSAQIPKQKGHINTEEATKTALVMPFIDALGYAVFDVAEVNPEFIADIGTKKGEKVDYAIMEGGKPIMLFECKSIGTDLKKTHASQLYRYFSVTPARIGILTNGIEYRFFADLEKQNVMDSTPFLVIDMTQVTDRTALQLKKFAKSFFNIEEILTTASELKYRYAIMSIMTEQMKSPSEDFVRFFVSQVYSGRQRQTVLKDFSEIVKQALQTFIVDQVNERLQSAIASGSKPPTEEVKALEIEESNEQGKQIVTTQEELDAYFIIKSILRETINPRRVTMRDTQSYCGILVDDNNRKPICRLYFNRPQKYVGFFDGNKNEESLAINDVDDIFQYADKLKENIATYL